jgi:peptidoglycan/LPS O-acetylase OafA/YrhL
MQRYAFIDAIRGIAALSVMLQHSLYQSGLLGDFAHHATLTGFIPTRLELGETGVVAFFLVSGFVIPLSLEKTASFMLFWLHRVEGRMGERSATHL